MTEISKLPAELKLAITIMITVVIVVIFIMWIRQKNMEELRWYAYRAFRNAEHMFKESGSGEEKMEWVVRQIRAKLPPLVQIIVTDKFVRETLQMWFNMIKDLLDDGKINDSQK